MRSTTFALFTVGAAIASAQSIPTCATGCVTDALPASCNMDPECICADASFIDTISCCVSTACDAAGQAAALGFAQQICAPVGVTNLPTAASCASGASSTGSASSTMAASSGTMSASTTVSASGSASTSASRTSAAVSSGSSVVSNTVASATGAADRVGVFGKGLAGVAALGALALL